MSVSPRMSVASPSQNQSVYQQPKKSSYQLNNPISQWGQSAVRGQGVRSIQSALGRPAVQKQPSVQMSRPQQPQQSRVIQGSGMSTQYASNPTNYKPKPVAPPVPPPQTQAPQDPTQKYLDILGSRAGQKASFIGEQRAAEEAATKARYGLAGEQIKAQLPTAQKNFNVFKENTLAGVDDVRASGERQKSNTSDYYGEAQRLAAKTFGETRAQDQRTFSNLNTIDSYGEGSFKQANENTTSEFNRFTQQTLKEKAQKLSEIDETVGRAEREATSLISQEEAKLQEFTQQIQFALMNNDQMMAEELRGLATQSQQLIFDLYDAVDNLKYTADLEKYKLEIENQPLGLSEQFMKTGEPQTEKDFIYRTQNPSGFSKIGAATTPKVSEKGQLFNLAAQSAQQALDLLDSGIANSGKGQAISSGFGKLFGSSSATQTDYESKLAAARGVAINALSGANVPPSEYERIADMIPVITDEPAIARQKLQSFVEIMGMYGQNMGQQQTSDSLSQDQIAEILASL